MESHREEQAIYETSIDEIIKKQSALDIEIVSFIIYLFFLSISIDLYDILSYQIRLRQNLRLDNKKEAKDINTSQASDSEEILHTDDDAKCFRKSWEILNLPIFFIVNLQFP